MTSMSDRKQNVQINTLQKNCVVLFDMPMAKVRFNSSHNQDGNRRGACELFIKCFIVSRVNRRPKRRNKREKLLLETLFFSCLMIYD